VFTRQELEIRIWRILPRLSADRRDLGDIQAIDANGMDRTDAS
jgi:hypothetical protein